MTFRFFSAPSRIFLPLLCACALTFVACDKDDNPDVNWGNGKSQPQPTPTPQPNPTPSQPTTPATLTPADRLAAARLEMPALTGQDGELFVVHRVALSGQRDSVVNYAYAYLPQSFHSRWVAFRFDAQTRPKVVQRKSYNVKPQYPRDPKLPTAWAIPSDLSFGRGYDHGHLVASADRVFSREANDQTFYMGNMSPQLSSFNQQYWNGLEELVQNLGRDAGFADTLYVVKGGALSPLSQYGYAANGRMPIPHHYFMALLKVKNGVYSSIGFWLEHKNYGKKGQAKEMGVHAVKISDLERLTGIDFFHNLPDAVEQRVESSLTLSAWRL